MKHLPPILRLTVDLACLTVSILLLASAIGLVPDRQSAVLQGRKALCEQLAIYCSYAVQRNDLDTVRISTQAVLQRNPDLESAAVRKVNGKLLFEAGEHAEAWDQSRAISSTATHIRVPIALNDKLWGTAELRFRPVEKGHLWMPMGSPVLPLLVFTAFSCLVCFFFYFRMFFRRSAEAGVVPRRVRSTLNTLAEGVVILDTNKRIAIANEAFASLVGKSACELQGCNITSLSWVGHRAESARADLPWARAGAEKTTQVGSVVGLDVEHGARQTLSVNSSPIVDEDGRQRGTLASFDNLTAIERKNVQLRKLLLRLRQSRTEVQLQNEQLKVMANHDPLTDCLNRRAFFQEFESHWTAAHRYGHPLSCIMVDIDHFKAINDQHGHAVGDGVLRHVAQTLKTVVRDSDLICRYGGEEFCILLPYVDIDAALQAADRFRCEIGSQAYGAMSVTASLGVSALSQKAREPRELLDQADQALYAAKRYGRNRVIGWDEEIGAAHQDNGRVVERQTARAQPPAEAVAVPYHAVTALVTALAYRHADTAEHSRRVADLCVLAASGLVPQSDCYILEVAAMLHDIGKIGVPDAVLLKPGPLNNEEWKVIRTHEDIGVEIIASAFSCPLLTDIVREHHCWYGRAKQDMSLPWGKNIAFGARILTIADAYDAMVSDRVYRKGRSREQAFAELRRCAGTQFDPELVERFIEAVLARDLSRAVSPLAVSKQTALRIGMHMERLANALDARDRSTLQAMAGKLRVAATEPGVEPIAEVAAHLQQSAAAGSDWAEVTRFTVELLDLCRATYSCYATSR